MITPIETNGIISRAQDISVMKQNEDMKSELMQLQSQGIHETKEDQYAHTVHSADDSNAPDTHHDAREKGRNEYFNQRKNKRKASLPEDRVVAKHTQGFDVKI